MIGNRSELIRDHTRFGWFGGCAGRDGPDLRRLGGVEILGMHGLEGIGQPLGPSAGSTASLTVRGFDFAEFYVP